MRMRPIHLNIEIWWQVRLNNDAHHPKSLLFTKPFPESEHQVIHALVVADSRIPVNIGSKNTSYRLLDLLRVIFIIRVRPINILVNLSKVTIGVVEFGVTLG